MSATFWLQEPGDVEGLVCDAESLLQVLPHGVFQGLLHVHQAGVDGLDHCQEGHPASPAAGKVLHRHAIPAAKRPRRPRCGSGQARPSPARSPHVAASQASEPPEMPIREALGPGRAVPNHPDLHFQGNRIMLE